MLKFVQHKGIKNGRLLTLSDQTSSLPYPT